ncbi:flavin reductase [Rhodoferax lacus]|uniref:Flavin reductase n=1 Tax=Rhodoferax lacus TaxID=2184758 RepID=A0A3E1RBR4_9BURK|nr:flavin reductase family protein [Rhodoferax lacus]RFO96703.1 flavin reductase [Rhodoferax lacus]
MNKFDSRELRTAMGRFTTGVTAISWDHDGEPMAMTVNAFMSISISPPLLAVSVKDASRFHRQITEQSQFAVNVLSQDQADISRHFGGSPQEGIGRPFSYRDGVPVINGAIVSFICKAENIIQAGDHHIYTGAIEVISDIEELEPLIFFGGKYFEPAQGVVSR